MAAFPNESAHSASVYSVPRKYANEQEYLDILARFCRVSGHTRYGLASRCNHRNQAGERCTHVTVFAPFDPKTAEAELKQTQNTLNSHEVGGGSPTWLKWFSSCEC